MVRPRVDFDGRGKYEQGTEKVGKKYTQYLLELAKEYDKKMSEQKKSDKESGKWVSMAALQKVRKKYGNAIKKLGYNLKSDTYKAGKEKRHENLIMKYLVSSLYLLHPPRRNSYANMTMITSTELSKEKKESNNYLVIVSRNNKYFHFADYKTSKTYGEQKIPLSKELNTVVNLWRNYNKTDHFLVDTRGNPMTKNGLTKFLYQVFAPTGKKISSSMIRHIYLTDKYGDESSYKEKKKDADSMSYSVGEQQKTYVKKS
jgi:hypothetical protein